MNRLRQLFLAPARLLTFGFFLAPLGIVVLYSFLTRGTYGGQGAPFTIENYVRLFDPLYGTILLRSFWLAAISTAICLLMGFPLALFIARSGKRRNLYINLVMLPFWTSYVIRIYAWMIILRDNGVVNSLLGAVGIPTVELLNTDLAVVFGMTYGFLPFTILPLYVAIDRLDPNLVQAARDLYASGRSAFIHVTLPLTMPGIIAAAILTFIPSIGDFVTPDLLGGAQTTTIAKVIQTLFLSAKDWPFGSALGFVLILITILGTVSGLRFLRREVIG